MNLILLAQERLLNLDFPFFYITFATNFTSSHRIYGVLYCFMRKPCCEFQNAIVFPAIDEMLQYITKLYGFSSQYVWQVESSVKYLQSIIQDKTMPFHISTL